MADLNAFYEKRERRRTIQALDIIEEVQKKPCLWDKNNHHFKSKPMRDNAWIQVCRNLAKEYDLRSEEEKEHMVKNITERWRNIKDAYWKIQRKPKASRRRYIYHDEMQFLMKNGPGLPRKNYGDHDDDDNVDDNGEDNGDDEEEGDNNDLDNKTIKTEFLYEADGLEDSEEFTVEYNGTDSGVKSSGIKRRKKEADEVYPQIVEFIPTGSRKIAQKRMDEDEMFFASILSSVRQMSSGDKLEFRMGVLALIKEINHKQPLE